MNTEPLRARSAKLIEAIRKGIPLRGIGKGVLRFIFIALAAGVGTTAMIVTLVALLGSGWSELGTGFIQSDPEHVSAVDCNVMALDVHGLIATYRDDSYAGQNGVLPTMTSSGELSGYLVEAQKDGGIKAVLLDVDSGGGYPQAAREISDALAASGKKSVAWIRGSGDSAAYWIASTVTVIVASEESEVGSIGVTSSYTDNAKQNTEQGLTYNSLSTGKFKDLGNPNKLLTAEERALVEKQNKTVLDGFIRHVATFRNLSEEKVRAIADGSTFLGQEAKDLGLIDRLGTRAEAYAALKDQIGEEPRVCWPQYK